MNALVALARRRLRSSLFRAVTPKIGDWREEMGTIRTHRKHGRTEGFAMITRERGSSGQHLTPEHVNRGAYRIWVQCVACRAGKYFRVHSDSTLDITNLVRKVAL